MNKLACLMLVLVVTFIACVGYQARQTMTLPGMTNAWNSAIAASAQRSATTPEDADAITAVAAGLASKDFANTDAADWLRVAELARADIRRQRAAGEIGPGMEESLMLEIALFLRSRDAYAGVKQ